MKVKILLNIGEKHQGPSGKTVPAYLEGHVYNVDEEVGRHLLDQSLAQVVPEDVPAAIVGHEALAPGITTLGPSVGGDLPLEPILPPAATVEHQAEQTKKAGEEKKRTK